MVRQRVRIRFSKSGNLKYIGHKDLLRTFESLFRRAGVPLAMSGGYHPKIRMSSPSALALGIEGFDEVLELEMNESVPTVDPDVLLADLNRRSVDGLEFLAARNLHETEKKAKLVSSVFEMLLPDGLHDGLADRIAAILACPSVIVEKPNGKSVDVREALLELSFFPSDGLLRAEILTRDGPEAGIREVLLALGLEKELFRSIFPKRVRCRIEGDAPEENQSGNSKN